MNPKLSQDYGVDGRYAFGKGATDNAAGKAFVESYLRRRHLADNPSMEGERRTEDRFIVRGPGDGGYSFRNGFRASK